MKIIFWNVDTQYDFMRPDGKLYVQGAEQIEGNLERLTKLAAENKLVVVNSADWHDKDSKEISDKPDFITKFPEHCMSKTKGAEFVPATNPENSYKVDWKQRQLDAGTLMEKRNITIYKDKFDVFQGNHYADRIVGIIAPERAIVYGVATNVCVNYAVNGLLERDVKVYVPLDAIKELPGLQLPYDNWQRKGAILTTTEDIHKILGGKR